MFPQVVWGGTRNGADPQQPWRRVPAMGVGWTLESILVGTCWAHLGLWNSAGQRNGQHCTSDSNSALCWAQLCSPGSPKKVKRPILLPMGTGTVNSFSKDNNQLRLFYLSRRMKAVFLYTSWGRHARQAQASRLHCMLTCLFGPSTGGAHAHWLPVTASAGPQLPPDSGGAGCCPPCMHPQQPGPFGNVGVLLIFCMHVHMSSQALGLFSCIQTAGTLEESQGSGCPPHCRLPHQCCLCMTPN